MAFASQRTGDLLRGVEDGGSSNPRVGCALTGSGSGASGFPSPAAGGVRAGSAGITSSFVAEGMPLSTPPAAPGVLPPRQVSPMKLAAAAGLAA